MKQKHNFKTFERALLFALCFSVLASFTKFNASCDTLRNNILRIHIIANSDSSEDQSVKLKVRDAVLSYSGKSFADCESLSLAESEAYKNLSQIKDICEETLLKYGFSYGCAIEIGKAYFETREYENFTLPAGYYDSLIVKLGGGNGHNWWCVLYPSVCIGGSKEKLKKLGNDSEIALNPNKYKIRFKTIELYEKLKKLAGKKE